jgi:3'-phosphoadenosine 5'-phosphosulfate sulfotransferase (PAPS reductase)/FAD synthetase
LAGIIVESDTVHPVLQEELEDRRLVPIGGGKDSCVTIELLLQQDKNITLFTNGKDYPIHQQIEQLT